MYSIECMHNVLILVAVPEKIAIDTGTNTIFITDSGQGEIVKIDYNGQNMETILTDGLQKPRGIALDSESRYTL